MQKTPLYERHVAAGGKIVDFNGWALPVQFQGIIEEHTHTREKAGLFDCSHMGEYRIHGAEAIEAFDRQIISDLSKLAVGRCRYGAILDEAGGILDDLITFRMSDDELYVVTNAGPLDVVTARICGGNDGAEHVSYETAKIDVQGPLARELLLEAGFKEASYLKYFNARWINWESHPILLSRTGYTGELGYELFMANELAEMVWDRFMNLGRIVPCGLGARDTLRTEVGYGLSGQDFDTSVTPLEAGMDPFIAWDTEFVGKDALLKKRDAGGYPVLVGFTTDSRRAPRHDMELKANGAAVGVVTSGTFGPSVGHGIGLGRVQPEYTAEGTQLTAGPRDLPVTVASPPFYKDGTCRIKVG